ncbi:MAG: SH3 domain-containing protein, partial [Chloroflexota bacterium]
MKRLIRTHVSSLFVVALSLLLLTGTGSVGAQETTPIGVGENKTGNLSDTSPEVSYSIAVGAPQSIQVQALAISVGLAPTFRVLDPGGVVVLDAANTGAQTIVQGSINLASPGAYVIAVRAANGASGQFLLSIQAGAPLAAPQMLTLGQALDGTLNGQTTRQAYAFSGSQSDALLLRVDSHDPASSEVIVMRDADTGETLSLTSASFGGIRFRILAGVRNYLLEVMHGGSPEAEAFTVCLTTANNPTACAESSTGSEAATLPPPATLVIPTDTLPATTAATFAPPTINPAGACQVASSGGQTINVRSGPGTNFSILTQLAPNVTAPVIGRLADNSWFQVNVNAVIGWVSASVVTLGGNCSGVSVVVLPTAVPPTITPTLAASATFTSTSTETPTSTPTPTNTPNGTPHLPPLHNLTLIAPLGTLQILQFPTTASRLDYSANPNYGAANLSAGFSPDPYSVGMTTGGNVNVAYLGSSCSGFATTAPDLRVNFGGGGASLLRIYFVGSNGD